MTQPMAAMEPVSAPFIPLTMIGAQLGWCLMGLHQPLLTEGSPVDLELVNAFRLSPQQSRERGEVRARSLSGPLPLPGLFPQLVITPPSARHRRSRSGCDRR